MTGAEAGKLGRTQQYCLIIHRIIEDMTRVTGAEAGKVGKKQQGR